MLSSRSPLARCGFAREAMAFRFLLDENLQKQLKALRKTGGRTSLVADHAESVMEKLALATAWDLKQTGRRTRHGEVRIKNCVKFDLVDGYRLLEMKQGWDIVFLYIGTHDECDRWIRKRSGLRSILEGCCAGMVVVKETVSYTHEEEEEHKSEDHAPFDEYPTEVIDERILRKVFRGLTGK
jgi:hypothetical protein